MTRTTPPRPVDVTRIAPGIEAFARTTLRLHPGRGNPSPLDSALGGPLPWRVDEPWPTCDWEHPWSRGLPRLPGSPFTSLRTVRGERTPEQQEEISGILRGQGIDQLVDERHNRRDLPTVRCGTGPLPLHRLVRVGRRKLPVASARGVRSCCRPRWNPTSRARHRDQDRAMVWHADLRMPHLVGPPPRRVHAVVPVTYVFAMKSAIEFE